MTLKKLHTDIEVHWPKWNKITNDTFIPLVKNKSKFLITYGGRGSGKSRFIALKIIYLLINSEHCRVVLLRQTLSSVTESSFREICDLIVELNLSSMFTILKHNHQIHCVNGNWAICRGMSEIHRVKSLKDYTHAWFEEEVPNDFGAFQTVVTTLRTKKADYIQLMFSINPEVQGDYKEHWFHQTFYTDIPELEHEAGHMYTGKVQIELEKDKIIEEEFTVHWSDYTDNPHVPDNFKAQLVDYARTDPYRYLIWTLGKWGYKSREGLWYKKFNHATNIVKADKAKFNPEKPIHLSIDFNYVPYMSAIIFQMDLESNRFYAIDEIKAATPHNSVVGLCKLFKERYAGHHAGLFIYGDVSGKAHSSLNEEGFNGYNIIARELRFYQPTFKVPNVNPGLKARQPFINSILASEIPSINFFISEKCKTLISDLHEVQEGEREAEKKKQVIKKDGKSFQKNAHFSDALDYFLCEAFKSEFARTLNGPGYGVRPRYGAEPFNDKHSY